MTKRGRVRALTLAALCAGCAGTGPANRVEDFQHLALQVESTPDQVRMAGKVQWHPGAESFGEGMGNLIADAEARNEAKCEAQKTKTKGWCFVVAKTYPDTGVFLLTDRELVFFRWETDAYVPTARTPFAEITKLKLNSWVGNKHLVIYKNGEPLLLYVMINRAISSIAGTKALYEALMERVQWDEAAPL